MRRHHEGFFITVEHADGVGGGTLSTTLVEKLRADGFAVIHSFEPGGTAFGREIRRLLGLRTDGEETPENPWRLSKAAELLLYQADRAQHYKEVLKPALKSGKIVVCDRYLDSTLAYQGHGRGFSIGLLLRLHALATGMLLPDLTVIVDGAARRDLSAGDSYERDASLQDRVRSAYLHMATTKPRYFVVDGGQSATDVAENAYQEALKRLDTRKRHRTSAP